MQSWEYGIQWVAGLQNGASSERWWSFPGGLGGGCVKSQLALWRNCFSGKMSKLGSL